MFLRALCATLTLGILSGCVTDIPLGNLPEAGTTIPCGANQCGGGFRCCAACGLCAFPNSDCVLVCSLGAPDSGPTIDSGRDSGLRDSGLRDSSVGDSAFRDSSVGDSAFPEGGPKDSGPLFDSGDGGSVDARFDGASMDSSF